MNNNHNGNRNGPHDDNHNLVRRGRRRYNTTFLNKKRDNFVLEDNANEVHVNSNEPPRKKHKSSPRKSMKKPVKLAFINYMHDNPTLTAVECKNQAQWVKKVPVADNTIEKWRTDFAKDTKKYKDLNAFVSRNPHSKQHRTATNPEKVQYGRFPTIEKYMLRRREERVAANRDRSIDWFIYETRKLLKDTELLDSLNLTEEEQTMIDEFKGSEGWVRKVMIRHHLITKKVTSDRKLTDEEYIELRPVYLENERSHCVGIGVIKDGKWIATLVYNGDEVPFCLPSFRRQISAPEERVAITAPPIVGHSKHRYGTIVPFISYGKLLFVCVIVKGGSTVRKELKIYYNKYKKWLLPMCNGKAFMNNGVWTKCADEVEYRTRQQRGCNMFGQTPKQSIVVYSDNCTSHSTDEQKEREIRSRKIHHRSLLPNASHLQQPVDQNVGIFMKNCIKRYYRDWSESILDEVDAKERESNEKVVTKEVRAKVFEFAYRAAEELSHKRHLMETAWINFGLELPMNGSMDGDINSLHANGGYAGRYEDIEWEEIQENNSEQKQDDAEENE